MSEQEHHKHLVANTLLLNEKLKSNFDDNKFKLTSFLKDMEPPEKYLKSVKSKRQETQLQTDESGVPTLGDLLKADQDIPLGKNMVTKLRGDMFKFTNKERYNMPFMKEQAMALVVPGYLQHVF